MNQPFWDVNMCHHVSTMVFTCVPGDATEDDATWSAVQQASWPRGPWSSVFIKNDHRVDMWYMCSIANRFFFIEADIMSIYLYYILYIYIFIPYICVSRGLRQRPSVGCCFHVPHHGHRELRDQVLGGCRLGVRGLMWAMWGPVGLLDLMVTWWTFDEFDENLMAEMNKILGRGLRFD
jgi:hypothetical protein